MLRRVIEPEILPLCRGEGIGRIVFQPLAQGVLTGKYLPGRPPPEGSRASSGGRAPRFIRRVPGEQLLESVQQLRPLADEAGLSMAQLDLVDRHPAKTAQMIAAEESWGLG
ncbi:aldo/keto reductase [Actinoplanes sp. NPDC023801]|uniref:aldo/keto reductase n=1 Tax=Actinoplanes sp. NPDC023801 TaxID=3154595 RepID=UPI0033DF1D94